METIAKIAPTKPNVRWLSLYFFTLLYWLVFGSIIVSVALYT